MSEHAPSSQEHAPAKHERESQPGSAEHHKGRAETAPTPEKQADLEAIQKSIETHAISGKETNRGEHQPQPEPVIGKSQIKAEAYREGLRKVRAKLRPPERALSKIVHQPVVESVSNVAATTAGRPSGILGGGIVALLGSAFVLYMSKYYGFRYNFFVFIVMFFGGFVLGLVIEMLLRLVIKRQPTNS
jgi:hypothetical protein